MCGLLAVTGVTTQVLMGLVLAGCSTPDSRIAANPAVFVAAEDLGGNMPRMLAYRALSGKAMVKHLRPIEATAVVNSERAYAHRIDTEDQTGDVELFD